MFTETGSYNFILDVDTKNCWKSAEKYDRNHGQPWSLTTIYFMLFFQDQKTII